MKRIYSVAENGQNRKQAFLNFRKANDVNEVMKDPLLISQEQEMPISRFLPKSCPFGGYMTTNLLLTIHGREVTEFDLKKYFKNFDPIIACSWQNDYQVILQFGQYKMIVFITFFDGFLLLVMI